MTFKVNEAVLQPCTGKKMSNSLDKITIKGFKSIKNLENFELNKLNILVGGNGAGKSNLISFFRMLNSLMNGTLNRFVRDNGGAGDILYNGRKTTEKMEFETHFGVRGLKFNLVPTPNNNCAIENEARYFAGGMSGWWLLGDSNDGSSRMVEEVINNHPDAKYSRPVYNAVSSWQIYHFHDTSSTAGMRNAEIIEDNDYLRQDASNIGSFLLKLKRESFKDYKAILNAIRLVSPFFDEFMFKPIQEGNSTKINLSWTQKNSDYPMQPYHLSDGTIRFICLATALLQPNPPTTIIIDEPELGMHPAAISILGELIQIASERTQVIVATQSPLLIDQFAIENIIVVNRDGGASTFKRLNEEDFSEWLKDYSVGQLWVKNVFSGGPAYE